MTLVVFALLLATACYQTARAIEAHRDYYALKREIEKTRR